MKVMTFSKQFPAYHPRKGQLTCFNSKIARSLGINDQILPDGGICSLEHFEPKHHTIRAGHRWKPGDIFTPVYWQLPGGMYTPGNKQNRIAPDITVLKTWDVALIQKNVDKVWFAISDRMISKKQFETVAANDGLSYEDLYSWFMDDPKFKKSKIFDGQIICWNDSVDY